VSNLYEFIDISSGLPQTQQQASMVQDNRKKTDFALQLLERMVKEPPKKEEPPKIPSLGALAIPN
jgi:hypothetical protein